MYSYQLTITNTETGKSETKEGHGDEDEIRAQLKEHGQHLESGDDWFTLFDDDEEDEDLCEVCDETADECICEDGPTI